MLYKKADGTVDEEVWDKEEEDDEEVLKHNYFLWKNSFVTFAKYNLEIRQALSRW